MKIAGKRFWMWFSVWTLAFFGLAGGNPRAAAQGTAKSTIMSPRDPQLSKDKDHKVTTHKAHIYDGLKTTQKQNAGVKPGTKIKDENPTESINKADTPGGVSGHKVNSKLAPHGYKTRTPKTTK